MVIMLTVNSDTPGAVCRGSLALMAGLLSAEEEARAVGDVAGTCLENPRVGIARNALVLWRLLVSRSLGCSGIALHVPFFIHEVSLGST